MARTTKKEIYNPEFKKGFLETEQDSTYNYTFNTISVVEKILGKDLCYFNISEIESLIQYYSPKTIGSAYHFKNMINKYLIYSIKNEKISINYIEEILKDYKNDSDWLIQFVNVFPYITLQKLIEIEDNPNINKQDTVIFRLLWEGCKPEEIPQIKLSDIDKNKINLHTGRDIIVSDRCIEMIDFALSENNYKIYDLNNKVNIRKREVFDFIDDPNNYIMRKTNTNVNNSESKGIISRRFKQVVKYLMMEDSKFPDMSPIDIIHSRMLYEGAKIYESRKLSGEYLDKQDYIQMSQIHGYSAHIYIRSHVNRTNIKRLYGQVNTLFSTDLKKQKRHFQNEWWKVKEENGRLGEKIVRCKLIELYGEDNIKKHSDFMGFDFEANTPNGETMNIEVKTTTSMNGKIYMTSNEIEKAEHYGDSYYLYIVYLTDKDKEIATIYIFNNPIKYFSIDPNIVNISCNTHSYISSSVSTICLQLTDELFNEYYNGINL